MTRAAATAVYDRDQAMLGHAHRIALIAALMGCGCAGPSGTRSATAAAAVDADTPAVADAAVAATRGQGPMAGSGGTGAGGTGGVAWGPAPDPTDAGATVDAAADAPARPDAAAAPPDAAGDAGTAPRDAPPPDTAPDALPANGLRAEYYLNMDLTELRLVRVDPNIDFDWGTKAPVSAVAPDHFSVRWIGKLTPPSTELFTFYTDADDGMRVFINDVPVVDDWSEHARREKSGTFMLTQGRAYDLRVEFFEAASFAVARLLWSSDSYVKAPVPSSVLTPAAPAGDAGAPDAAPGN